MSDTEIELRWKGHAYDVNFDEYPNGLEQATLADLKEKAKRITGVPVNAMKLLASGAVMKDDSSPLSLYGLRPGSKVLLLGQRPNARQTEQTASGNPEEASLISRINHILKDMTDNKLKINEYEHEVGKFVQSRNQDPKAKKKLLEMGMYLSEKLMQALLALDGIQCQPGFHTARQKRKEGVNLAQDLHDRVDQIKAILKNANL
ncbi:hypothetical protein VKS41_007014 [Umbelopsis sp. WA50703]